MRTGLTLICAMLFLVLAALEPRSGRIALAQTPEETPREIPQATPLPETFTDFLKQQWARPKTAEPEPDSTHDTLDIMKRARGRASGTPGPEPTPKW
jgi:hypothetical protein